MLKKQTTKKTHKQKKKWKKKKKKMKKKNPSFSFQANENLSEPMLTQRKNPLRGGSNPQCCITQDSEPNTQPTELFQALFLSIKYTCPTDSLTLRRCMTSSAIPVHSTTTVSGSLCSSVTVTFHTALPFSRTSASSISCLCQQDK